MLNKYVTSDANGVEEIDNIITGLVVYVLPPNGRIEDSPTHKTGIPTHISKKVDLTTESVFVCFYPTHEDNLAIAVIPSYLVEPCTKVEAKLYSGGRLVPDILNLTTK